MSYFRFEIPLNSDGTRVTYSPGWHGEMPQCPTGVKVLLYNDKWGYGIAQTEDKFVPKEVKVIEEKEALALVAGAEAENLDGVFFGEKLANRWLPEADVKEVEPKPTSVGIQPVGTKAVFCPICHQFIMFFPNNIIAETINLVCPSGHKVILSGGG